MVMSDFWLERPFGTMANREKSRLRDVTVCSVESCSRASTANWVAKASYQRWRSCEELVHVSIRLKLVKAVLIKGDGAERVFEGNVFTAYRYKGCLAPKGRPKWTGRR